MGKPEIQRIEVTLDRLHQQGVETSDSATLAQGCSFKIHSAPQPHRPQQFTSTDVQPFPAQTYPPLPTLPKFKLPSFSSHRHSANPALAMDAFKQVEAIIAGWQSELKQIVQQVQNLYLEGPIIDGWLESPQQTTPPTQTTSLRHAEIDRLMSYVEEICSTQPTPPFSDPQHGYRLCGLDADGKTWSRPCPPEQVPHVSLAIARYQRLRQLLGRKQDLDARLSQVAGTMEELYQHLSLMR